MRLWIGPDGEFIDLDGGELSHSECVVRDPEAFGLVQAPLEEHVKRTLDGDGDEDFDYDTVIVLAETAGWTRISADSASGFAVSASSAAAARRALRRLMESGLASPEAVDIEIERFEGVGVRRGYVSLEGRALEAFVARGALGRAEEHLSDVADPRLLDALETETSRTMRR